VAATDRTLGALVALLGLLSIWEARQVWNGWDGTGLWPLLVGAALLGLAPVFLLFPWREGGGLSFDRGESRRVAFIGGAFAIYIGLMAPLGYLLATWLFLAGITRYMSHRRFPVTLLWTGAVAVGTYIVFKKLLGMYLPLGLVNL
jgi:hypothetical protein